MYNAYQALKSIFNYILFFFIKKLIKYAKGQRIIMKRTFHTFTIIKLKCFWNRIIKATFLAKSLKGITNAAYGFNPMGVTATSTWSIKQTILSVFILSYIITQKLLGRLTCFHGWKIARSGTTITMAARSGTTITVAASMHTESSQVPQRICSELVKTVH